MKTASTGHLSSKMNDSATPDLTQEVARLTELNDLKTKFIHAAIHQMRTPVSVVRWTVEMMLGANANVQTDDPTIKNLQAIYKANDTIRLRIDDLLSALNIEENKVTLEKTDTTIEPLIETVIKNLGDEASQKHITLTLSKPDQPLPPLTIDVEKIKSALHKLILNAIDYSDSDGKVVVKLDQNNGKIRVEINDNGIGIPDGEHDIIFERFGRASNAASMQPSGYGLGLYIAAHFIKAHGGTIGLESQANGSTFWFELPITHQQITYEKTS